MRRGAAARKRVHRLYKREALAIVATSRLRLSQPNAAVEILVAVTPDESARDQGWLSVRFQVLLTGAPQAFLAGRAADLSRLILRIGPCTLRVDVTREPDEALARRPFRFRASCYLWRVADEAKLKAAR